MLYIGEVSRNCQRSFLFWGRREGFWLSRQTAAPFFRAAMTARGGFCRMKSPEKERTQKDGIAAEAIVSVGFVLSDARNREGALRPNLFWLDWQKNRFIFPVPFAPFRISLSLNFLPARVITV